MRKIASYSLAKIQKTFSSVDELVMTYSAKQGQYKLGMSDQDVIAAIQELTIKDFYKTMPPVKVGFTDWQDVYKTNYAGIEIYIKFQKSNDGHLIVSFKEK